ncbi:MAG: class IV adenylate cyclase [Candidatus Altiarchaeota archaeon]
MALEVEIKCKCLDAKKVENKLLDMRAVFEKEVSQDDTYFNSPWRDFEKTDEALRLRREGDVSYLTFKGPKIDSETKAREEINVECKQEIGGIFNKLDYSIAGIIRKKRRIFSFKKFIVSVDSVEGLGCFIEIESDDLDDKKEMFLLLEKIGLSRGDCTTKSYLELILDKAEEKQHKSPD